jgi:hypothetical protein
MALVIIAIVGVAAILLMAGGGILGSRLSASEIAGYAQNAGFSGSDLTMAVAVALAESSGNPAAHGDLAITPGGSVGLWQINLKYHPEFNGQDLTDPQTNANAAYAIYHKAGNRFTDWSTYNDGISGNLLAQAGQGVTDMQSAGMESA